MTPRIRFRAVLFVFVVAAFRPAAGQEAVSPTGYYAEYQQAMSLYNDGRFVRAEPRLAALADQAPYDDPALWFRLARARDRLGQSEPAIQAYRTAVEVGYRYGAWMPYRVAQLYARLGAVDSAFQWLHRALEAGLGDRAAIADDETFSALREDPRFPGITGRPTADLSRDEGWRYDVDYLVREAKRIHSGPGRPAFSERFDSAARSLEEAIPGLSNDAILAELQRLITLLGDGHTGIYGPGPDSPLEFHEGSLPVLFYAFEDGLYIVDAAGEARRWIGARVTAFGPQPTQHVLAALPKYMHHDNAMTPRWLGVHFALRRFSFLQAVGATDDPAGVTLTLRDSQGRDQDVRFEAEDASFPRKLRAPADLSSPPRWLRHVDRNYWLEPIPAARAMYWQFNQVRDLEGGPSLAAFADTLRAALTDHGARSLIVDVRHNNGGNNGLLDPLLRTLVWWEQAEPDHRVFVITGRNTFSAAQNFINRVERWTDAVFVGEPSSSRPNFSGEETGLVLPYSRIRGSISNRYWQDSDPDDRRPWIAPSIPVSLSSHDYFTGHDPALAAILDVIRRGDL